MDTPFVGSEAVTAGLVAKHQLRNPRGPFVAVFPDIYTRRTVLTIHHRATAAWLWSHRGGVLAGLTASALHGAQYVEDAVPIELIWPNRRPPRGIVTLKMSVAADEVTERRGLPLTTVERTAFDLGRRGHLDDAIARLDALGNASGFRVDEVLRLAENHRGARGMRQLSVALDLHDPGAESPRETWLRLLIIRAGYPRPTTQIPVTSIDGRRRYRLDMGWKEPKLAVEYDGDHHRKDPLQFAHDIIRSEDLDDLGWTRVRVAKRHRTADVLARLSRAWAATVHSDREIA